MFGVRYELGLQHVDEQLRISRKSSNVVTVETSRSRDGLETTNVSSRSRLGSRAIASRRAAHTVAAVGAILTSMTVVA